MSKALDKGVDVSPLPITGLLADFRQITWPSSGPASYQFPGITSAPCI